MVTPNAFAYRLLRFTLQDLLFILGSHKYLRIMLESYFQPKIKKEHEENKNI